MIQLLTKLFVLVYLAILSKVQAKNSCCHSIRPNSGFAQYYGGQDLDGWFNQINEIPANITDLEIFNQPFTSCPIIDNQSGTPVCVSNGVANTISTLPELLKNGTANCPYMTPAQLFSNFIGGLRCTGYAYIGGPGQTSACSGNFPYFACRYSGLNDTSTDYYPGYVGTPTFIPQKIPGSGIAYMTLVSIIDSYPLNFGGCPSTFSWPFTPGLITVPLSYALCIPSLPIILADASPKGITIAGSLIYYQAISGSAKHSTSFPGAVQLTVDGEAGMYLVIAAIQGPEQCANNAGLLYCYYRLEGNNFLEYLLHQWDPED